MRSLLALGFLSVCSGSLVAKEDPPPAVNCDFIGNLVLHGHDFGSVAKLVCGYWPTASFGAFPISSVTEIEGMVNDIFEPDGLWDELQKAFKSEATNQKFCVRREAQREDMVPTGASCPQVVNQEVKDEFVSSGNTAEEEVAAEGHWSCTNSAEGDGCTCRRRDQTSFLAAQKTAETPKRPDGCVMVHQDRCYGNCPRGYQPVPLLGGFRPVCTSICAETTHPYGCGIGCSDSPKNCLLTLVEQVRGIVGKISSVVSYVHNATDAYSDKKALEVVTEFALGTLNKYIAKATEVWEGLVRQYTEFGLILVLFTFIKELQEQVGDDPESMTMAELEELMKTIVDFVLELIDAQFRWEDISIEWIADIILNQTTTKVQSLFKTIQGFTWNECELAGDTVSFTVEDAGDERLLGPWNLQGTMNEKPRYYKQEDKDAMLEWNARDSVWKFFYFDRSSGRGRWFGWLGLGWNELYRSEAATATFPTTGWTRVNGESPIPNVISVTESSAITS